MEWLWLIGVALAAAFFSVVRANGKRAGHQEAQHEAATVAEQLDGRLADAELEAELNKPLLAKLAALRERIKSRRGVG